MRMAVRNMAGSLMCVLLLTSVLIIITVTWYSGFNQKLKITSMYSGLRNQASDSQNGLLGNSYRKLTNVRKDDTFRKDGNLRKVSGMLDIDTESKFSNEDFFRNADVYENVTCKSDSSMTDIRMSKLKLLKTNANTNEVTVLVTARNGQNQERTSGGDVIVIWAEQVGSDGRVSGSVTDQTNGTYIGCVRIFWSGETVIKAKLLSTIENMCVRYNALTKYGNTVFALKNGDWIKACYQKTSVSSMARCGVNNNIYGLKQLCNFTTLNDGQNWYCGAPTNANLSCDDISSFTNTRYDTEKIIPNRNESELIQIPGDGEFTDTVHVSAIRYARTTAEQAPCSTRPKIMSWTGDQPAGHALNNYWHISGCVAPVPSTVQSYRRCLAHKHVYVMGDSTIRQYEEYLVEQVLSIKIAATEIHFRRNRHHNEYNITVDYIRHEMPFYSVVHIPAFGIFSLPSYIDNITNGDTDGRGEILLVGLNAHFHAYPAEEFQLRIRYISQAINRLLRKKSNVTVLIKGPHIMLRDREWFDNRISLLYRDIIYTEFNELKDRVIYLDTWSISVAHNSHLIHPGGSAFQSQVQQFMSYICDPSHGT